MASTPSQGDRCGVAYPRVLRLSLSFYEKFIAVRLREIDRYLIVCRQVFIASSIYFNLFSTVTNVEI